MEFLFIYVAGLTARDKGTIGVFPEKVVYDVKFTTGIEVTVTTVVVKTVVTVVTV